MSTVNPYSQEIMQTAGYTQIKPLATTLQGIIWKAHDESTRSSVVIKEANKELHQSACAMIDNRTYSVDENILDELAILKYLSGDAKCPPSMVKFIRSFQRYSLSFYYVYIQIVFNII